MTRSPPSAARSSARLARCGPKPSGTTPPYVRSTRRISASTPHAPSTSRFPRTDATVDLRLSDEQQQLVDAFTGLYAKHATPERVRAAEPLGFDTALWDQVQSLGAVAMAVPEAAGGWGASPLDLALVAEQQGRFVAPAPVIETQVAARLLARIGGDRATS